MVSISRAYWMGSGLNHEIKEFNQTFSDSLLLYTFTGIVNQNEDPLSSSEVTPIAPPINFTNWREMDRPSPVPPKRRVEEFWRVLLKGQQLCDMVHTSACWKGTNNWSTSLAERPIPVSLLIKFQPRKCYRRLKHYWISNLRGTSRGDELGILSTKQRTVTDPEAVNLTAFPIRFMSTNSSTV